MNRKNREPLETRVVQAAEAALRDHQYVSIIDVLCGMGLLYPGHVQAWRNGRIDYLESMIQGNPRKIAASMEAFLQWARNNGLRPAETSYTRTTRAGTVKLRFTESGDPEIEKIFRTHYVSPALSERKREQLADKLNRAPQPVVFDNLRESRCSECGAELPPGSFLMMEADRPLCLACARMDDLEFLPSGDAALTRRAGKYSERSAVVVRFSRSRGRYERQGLLVEPAALEKAEHECLADADQRAGARKYAVAARLEADRELAVRMTAQIMALFPACPPEEAAAIAAHTAVRGSGRVGRTAAGRDLEEHALTAAVIAAVRHRHTEYESLLASGVDRAAARELVTERVEEMLEAWRG